MRRLPILLCLIVVAWFAFETEPNTSIAGGTTAQTCCAPGTGHSPHMGCVGGMCQDITGCGQDDCSACTACDPVAEQNCIAMGWIWDPTTCSCNPPHCDPAQQQQCISRGGTWDDTNCTCSLPCNPGQPVLVNETSASYQQCTAGALYDCTVTWATFEQYCQDGSLYARWTEETTLCSPSSNGNGSNCYS